MNELKDSGQRTEFSTGACRDVHEGKGRFDLLPMCVLIRLAKHYENGCKKIRRTQLGKWDSLPLFRRQRISALGKVHGRLDRRRSSDCRYLESVRIGMDGGKANGVDGHSCKNLVPATEGCLTMEDQSRKLCYGLCDRCAWRYNGGCSEWID